MPKMKWVSKISMMQDNLGKAAHSLPPWQDKESAEAKHQHQFTVNDNSIKRKKKWATHHVQQHFHEAFPELTCCQLGRMSCEGTTVLALPWGKDLLYSAKSLGKEWDEHWDRNDKNVRWSDMVMLRSTSPSRYFYSPTFLWSIQDKPIWVGGIFPWSTTWAGLCNCTGVPWITSIWL